MPVGPRFAALSNLARDLILNRGHAGQSALDAFFEVGFDREQVLEVVGVVAASTITNYVASVTEPPLEAWLVPQAWTHAT